ncbi:LacI family DNA-binding transcriptional regulator [Gorillibacterium sp. CAU 1737]|uniref:LacI family DNA-binding transcriptional regulator n=1 Tax=Gorillibacterium sp. CAU 1737 TaxID=3140362 RepID=UPI0032611726
MKKVTLQMIADRLGVSKALVSKALSHDPAVSNTTREEIRKTAEELGYNFDKLRKSAAYGRTGNIAVLVPEAYLDDIEYWGRILRGIDKELASHGFSMLLSSINLSLTPEEGLPSAIREQKADGALLLGHIPEEYGRLLEAKEVPFVLIDSNVRSGKHDHILANNFFGAYEAVNRLLDSGHASVAFVGDMETAWSFKERGRGFEEAVRDRNNRNGDEGVRMQWVRGAGVSGRGNYTSSAFAEELKQAVSAGVTGFFCANDMLAVELLHQMTRLGIHCPDEYSLIGFDDLSLSAILYPRLTTVRVPKEQMGARAVQAILERLKQPERVPEQILFATELMERDSVKKLRS